MTFSRLPFTRRVSALLLLSGGIAAIGFAQAPPPPLPPGQLDGLVNRIALYPDSLVAQILAAATFADQIPAAAQWSDEHHYLSGQALVAAMQGDQVPWDPSVQALLPFPSVLGMMASDMAWTQALGNAFLVQQPDVMEAVQRERRLAYQYGYLRTNPQVVVSNGPYITIAPVNPGFIVVPAYNPAVVFFAPRPGFFVGGAIGWGFGIGIGTYFRPWGWGVSTIGWGTHAVFIGGAPWGRTWVNRGVYVHPWPHTVVVARPGPVMRPGERPVPARVVEQHHVEARSAAERDAARDGHARPREEHHH